jgi:hypothetical protein
MSQGQPEPGEHQSSAGTAPSAEEFKERLEKIGDQSNLGAGENEPDPATAQNPPSDLEAGDQKRTQT